MLTTRLRQDLDGELKKGCIKLSEYVCNEFRIVISSLRNAEIKHDSVPRVGSPTNVEEKQSPAPQPTNDVSTTETGAESSAPQQNYNNSKTYALPRHRHIPQQPVDMETTTVVLEDDTIEVAVQWFNLDRVRRIFVQSIS